MTKIGRNAPCPCGSGKKYKKCCMDKQIHHTPKYEVMRSTHWNMEEIRAFSTEQIIKKLQSFGVDFKKEEFLKNVKHFYSGSELAKHWYKIYPIAAKGFDLDFIWMACVILWERLAPDVINSEKIDELMQEGYRLLETKGSKDACIAWLEVWEYLKERFSDEMKSIDDAEQVFSGLQSLYNWCQDFEMELGNAGVEDTEFYKKRIKYCKEFYSFFPKSDELIILNMKRAEAESYFKIGMVNQGEECFKALIEQFPDSAWGYIGWGDMYAFVNNVGVHRNYEKADKIYRMALERNIDYKQDVLCRLEDLKKEKHKNSMNDK